MDQLLRYGEVQHGRIGVAIQDLTPDRRSLRLARQRSGASSPQVEPGSPAEQAGLRPGDVVVALDGAPVRSATDLRNRLGLAEAGSRVELGYLRERARGPAGPRSAPQRSAPAGWRQVPQLPGASVIDLPEDHPAYGQVDGVLVIGGARQRRGARRPGPGDVILAVDGRPSARSRS